MEKAEGLEFGLTKMQMVHIVTRELTFSDLKSRKKTSLLGGQKTVQGVQFSEKCGGDYNGQNMVKLTS